MKSLFHLALNVRDLHQARAFYGGLLACQEGRSTKTWVDFDFFGHQLSLHLGKPFRTERTGMVGEHKVPMPHLGVILSSGDWRHLADRLDKAKIDFIIEPTTRFLGQAGEQNTMFFNDPFGNPIEIKGFASFDQVFQS